MSLCQLKHLSCIGCCGRDLKTKKEIEKDIDKNTEKFRKIKKDIFAKLNEKTLKQSGVCGSLIKEKGRIFCPLHPKQNNGKDYRDNVCDKDYYCPTLKAFLLWERDKQDRFLKFLLKKDLDWYSYSIGIDNSNLMHEFLEKDSMLF